ncbi:MAG: fibronectin type III domain-containing protein [Dorea sp.]|nr:fibronectin type III domain-containing protein [Dorea sp.]
MKRRSIREMLKRTAAATLVMAMIFTADAGLVFAQEEELLLDADQTYEEQLPAEAEPTYEEQLPGKEAVEDLPDLPEVSESGAEDTFTQEEENPCAEGHTPYEKVRRSSLTADGNVTEYCSVCGSKLSTRVLAHPETFKFADKVIAYTGKNLQPEIVVSSSRGQIDPSNYTVTYENNKTVGVAKAILTFNGIYYKGTKELSFTIKPKATQILSLTPATTVKTMNVKWEKVAAQVSGYQIQYAADSKFTSPVSINVKGNSTFLYSLKNLKEAKKYYVRVRTYKKVGTKTYYAVWSKVLSATTYTADEIGAWKAAANVVKNGKAMKFSTMNAYIWNESYESLTSAEKIFYDIFKEENARSYSYKLVGVKTNTANNITVKVQVSSKNYYEAAYEGYMKTVDDVDRSGNESETYIFNCLKKYTLAAAEGKYPPFTSKYTADFTVIRRNGVWKVKQIPDEVVNTFTCFADMGISFAENDLLE